jgi:hypothetical protein
VLQTTEVCYFVIAAIVHFATRLPKHLIMAALVNVVDRHRAEVETEARLAAGE